MEKMIKMVIITYSGKRFTDHFSSFIEKYGFSDLYTSSFYPFQTEEEKWAYWAKHISLNRYEMGATKLYMEIFDLVKDKGLRLIRSASPNYVLACGIGHPHSKG
jgi:hypothetical protein